MSAENEQTLGNSPGPIPPPASRPAPGRKYHEFEIEQRKKPMVYPPFFFWTPLFFFVVALVTYFFFPDALDDAIALAYKEYNKYMPATETPAPTPLVAAIPAPKPAPPTQTYSVQEIKDGVQDHLVEAGLAQRDSTFDWKRLEYTDPTDLMYELYAHSAEGQVELCMGKVSLDLQMHRMFVTSQLVGW